MLFVNNCSNQIDTNDSNNSEETPEYLYKLAMTNFDSENYDDAEIYFEKINTKFPLSNESVQSQIMLAFTDYIKMNYDESIFKFTRIINNYPSHKNIDYVYYMRAMCYYEQIEKETLDGSQSLNALEGFNQITNRFPSSKYANDSKQKIIFVNENIAAKHMDIALFYSKQNKYNAAINRYKKVIKDYSTSKFTPEALHRLVEIYYKLGMIENANKTAAIIAYNYPKSKWYKYSYDIVGEQKEKESNFFKKLSNFLTNKDDKKE